MPAGPALAAPATATVLLPQLPTQQARTPSATRPAVTKQTTSNLNLRARASTGSKVLLTIPRGTKLRVLGTSGKWIKVTYKSKTGWASGDYLKTVANPVTKRYRYAQMAGILLAEADAGSNVLIKVAKGMKVQLLKTAGNWSKVRIGARSGWMESANLGEAAPKPKQKVYLWTTAKASVRTKPDSGSKRFGMINAKTRVEYVRKSGSWRQVKTGLGTGWVLATQLSGKDPAVKEYRWTTGAVNLRKGPSTSKASRGLIPAWEKVIHHRVSGAWSEVTTSKGRGWVANTGLSKSGPLPVAVYGTLRPGQGPYTVMVKGKTTREDRTRIVDHDLYIDRKSGLSYILPEPSKATGVVAYRMTLKKGIYSSTVARLDAYERYNPSKSPDNQLYVRKRVTDRDGKTVWAYVGGSKMSHYLRTSGTRVSTGDYLKRF